MRVLVVGVQLEYVTKDRVGISVIELDLIHLFSTSNADDVGVLQPVHTVSLSPTLNLLPKSL